MRLFLMCAMLCAIAQRSSADDSKCISEKFKNSFYKIRTIRQFSGGNIDWVAYQNGTPYYSLNGKTFNVADASKDDVMQNDIRPKGQNPIQIDAITAVFKSNTDLFISKNNKDIKIIANNYSDDYLFVYSPNQIVFILTFNSGVQNDYRGNLYWLATNKVPRGRDAIDATFVRQFAGSSLSSIDVDSKTNNILIGGIKNGIGSIYLMEHFDSDPCTQEEKKWQKINENAEQDAMNFIQQAHNDYTARSTQLRCESSLNLQRNSNETKRGSQGGKTTTRTYTAQFSDPNRAECIRLKALDGFFRKARRAVMFLVDEQRKAKTHLENQKIKLEESYQRLNGLINTALLNKQLPTSVFSVKTPPDEVPGDLGFRYICVTKDELERGEKELDIGEQLSYLKSALEVVKGDLEDIQDDNYKHEAEILGPAEIDVRFSAS